jgi:methionyl-tRNA synthetase
MKIIVTSALPYANGPIHIGHLVEYIQTDIYVRFLKLSNKDAIYCCADDTHGTPIEINASSLGIPPEKLIEKYHKEHLEDFQKFMVEFDNFYTTNSPENKEFSDFFFTKLKSNGDIYEKEIELTYCENCKRFLPDRYVVGTCPKCKNEGQYGDNCEKCNATYEPVDLIEPKCIICSNTPVRKKSRHYFFKLSNYAEKLKKWLNNNENLQQEVKNYVLNWINEGLKDWDITRDAPYFGFKIVGEKDKYYYVWLDAPIGYIASCKNYCDRNNLSYEEYWMSDNGKIIHFIGKDIIYFHFLFWPAMLMGVGFNLPENIVVHGFLTINNQKMSKSRGTFITAKDFANKINPEYLRFYYAAILSHSLKDINLETEDLKNRINSELIDNFGNLTNRCLTFLYKNFNGEITDFSFQEYEKEILQLAENVVNFYNKIDLNQAVRKIMEIGLIANKFFQDSAPWSLIKTDRTKAQQVLSFTVNVIKIMSTLLKPIIPATIKKLEKTLNIGDLTIDKNLNFDLKTGAILKPKILFKKLENIDLIEQPPASKLVLKSGKIIEINDHPDADKLYVLKVDFNSEIRTIVSGIKDFYSKEELINKTAIFVFNLKPAKIRGIESNGMILASKSDGNLGIILTDAPAGCLVEIENIDLNQNAQITIKDFQKIKLDSNGENVFCDSNKIFIKSYKIFPDKAIKGKVG